MSYKYWSLPAIFLVVLATIYLYLHGARKTVLVSQIKSISESQVLKSSENIEKKEETPCFSRQLALLNMPWGRDTFNLESLKKVAHEIKTKSNTEMLTINERLLNLELTGIVFFDNHYMALINNSGVREGDTILGFKLLKIEREYIVIADGTGKTYTLELN